MGETAIQDGTETMRLLVLGGTRFIGRHLVEMALARGHEVTLFNRGHTDPGAFPGVEHVAGDRAQGLGPLAGRRFDAVVDISGQVADWVRRSVEDTEDTGAHYVFVSATAVYRAVPRAGMEEDAPPLHFPDWQSTNMHGPAYGAMKVACEVAVPPDGTIVRPGMVIGPGDYTDRFPSWVRRLARGGEVLAPGDPARPVQAIDARDLAAFLLHAATERLAGTFHAVGHRLGFAEMLEATRAATGSDARLTWVDDGFLREHGLEPWGDELPFWTDPGDANFFTLSNRRAVEAGLRLRPLADTARDTAAWEPTRAPSARTGGPPPEHEAELLRQWRAHQSVG